MAPPGLVDLISKIKAHRVQAWDNCYGLEAVEDPAEIDRADVVSSELRDVPGHHVLVLDLDYPAYVVPSTTEGHTHLFLDLPEGISTNGLEEILRVLAKHGVIEEGYAGASIKRGYTSVRVPGTEKGRPILRCYRCNKRPDELEEYIEEAEHDAGFLTPDDYVWEEEGTLDRETGAFACTSCYIAVGQPLGKAPFKLDIIF